ncbi:MAG TPA: hypothetical protein VFD03_07765 [Clostridia bacterium]|nr:hypothetical protein [Clostridia bacterium]
MHKNKRKVVLTLPDKARGVLGWKAETDLMEGLRMTYLSRRA